MSAFDRPLVQTPDDRFGSTATTIVTLNNGVGGMESFGGVGITVPEDSVATIHRNT